jgi:hypothetical protein
MLMVPDRVGYPQVTSSRLALSFDPATGCLTEVSVQGANGPR